MPLVSQSWSPDVPQFDPAIGIFGHDENLLGPEFGTWQNEDFWCAILEGTPEITPSIEPAESASCFPQSESMHFALAVGPEPQLRPFL